MLSWCLLQTKKKYFQWLPRTILTSRPQLHAAGGRTSLCKIASRLFLFYLLFSILSSFFFFRGAGKTLSAHYFCTSNLRFSRQSSADKGGSNLRRRDCESRRVNHETTFKGHQGRVAGTTARAIRHARSPQRVHRAHDSFARNHGESNPTHDPR